MEMPSMASGGDRHRPPAYDVADEDMGYCAGWKSIFCRCCHDKATQFCNSSYGRVSMYVFVVAVLFLIAFLIPQSISYIGQGSVGLKRNDVTNEVKTRKTYYPGRHFVGPRFSFVLFDVREFEYCDSAEVGALAMKCDYCVVFKRDPKRVSEIYNKFSTGDRAQSKSDIAEAFREVLQTVNVTDVYTDQFRISSLVRERVLANTEVPILMRNDAVTFRCTPPSSILQRDMNTLLQQIENDNLFETQRLTDVTTAIESARLVIETVRNNTERTTRATVARITTEAELDAKTLTDTAKTDELGRFYATANITNTADQTTIINYLILRGVI